MDWISENFQIVIFVALIVGTFVKQFLEAKAEERRAANERELNPPEEDVFGPEDDWEVEPAPMAPPVPSGPPPLQRTTPPPLAFPPPMPRNLDAEEAMLKRQEEMQERLRAAREAKQAKAKAAEKESEPNVPRSWKKAAEPSKRVISSREELRKAIILREVLGPPVGFR